MNQLEAREALREIEIVSLLCTPQTVRVGESYTALIRFRRPISPDIASSLDQWNHDSNRQEFSQTLPSNGQNPLSLQFWVDWLDVLSGNPPRTFSGREARTIVRSLPIHVLGANPITRVIPAQEILRELENEITALTANTAVHLSKPYAISVGRGGIYARLSGKYRPVDIGVDLPVLGNVDPSALAEADIDYIDFRIVVAGRSSEAVSLDYDHFNVHVDFDWYIELSTGGAVEFVENWIENHRIPGILKANLLRRLEEFVRERQPRDVSPKYFLYRAHFSRDGLSFVYLPRVDTPHTGGNHY
jgi:hypothetical protein